MIVEAGEEEEEEEEERVRGGVEEERARERQRVGGKGWGRGGWGEGGVRCFDGRKEAGRRAETGRVCAINASVCFFLSDDDDCGKERGGKAG